jgi:UDP-3-O-[3-hydroxymyristoyl] N-acetylglucosamine deacetylase
MYQKTLRKSFMLKGIGLHTGTVVSIKVCPASADHGIVFKRVDLSTGDNLVKASFENVTETYLRTELSNKSGVSITTAEHLLAAFAGTGLQNAIVEISSKEVPIFDGSSKVFVREILKAGLKEQDKALSIFEVIKPFRVELSESWAEVRPASKFAIDFEIEWPGTALGRQSLDIPIVNGTFVRELCDSRTFCKRRDVDRFKDSGFALGGGIENAIVVEEDSFVALNGLRYGDECIRHKILDALGDLSLVGKPILGKFISYAGGHKLTNLLLREAFKKGDIFRSKYLSGGDRDKLPGFDISNKDLEKLSEN